MIRHKRELKAFISHLAAAEVEVSITALYNFLSQNYDLYFNFEVLDRVMQKNSPSKTYKVLNFDILCKV
ncbi:hypothetical protein BpHYR1_020961 [Brachionus plicatilis]|uniref:Uncharacterized protein n=1 Tax=Brachionus plicatilis TaxID=10195 RepID=A0A3M7RSZ8_BRAPC|nr:hypothetical protein BpHYR1_020961 [Brachionus plicatilis]